MFLSKFEVGGGREKDVCTEHLPNAHALIAGLCYFIGMVAQNQ